MASKSKFFRVAVEGATATDGRTIERQWIVDMAAGYNRETYGARVNMEHIKGFSPTPPFNAYGDVLALKSEEVTIKLNGKDEKRLALFAEIDPTDDLVKVTGARQKIYTSIEVATNFANTGKAGLVGLACTDNPASLGTDILAFSATANNAAAAALKASFDARKTDKANLFSAAEETSIEYVDDAAGGDKGESALEKFAVMLANAITGKKEEPKIELKADPAPPAGGDVALATMLAGLTTALTADRKADQAASDAKFAKLTSTVEQLATAIETTPRKHSARPDHTGGSGRSLAQY